MANSRDGASPQRKTSARPEAHPELVDVRTVAALMGSCSIRHVYRLADANRMPQPVKIGRLIRWRRSELLGWIEGGCLPMCQHQASRS